MMHAVDPMTTNMIEKCAVFQPRVMDIGLPYLQRKNDFAKVGLSNLSSGAKSKFIE